MPQRRIPQLPSEITGEITASDDPKIPKVDLRSIINGENRFNIYEITGDSIDYEPLGTKEKFWFIHKENDSKWLFKYSTAGTGEHWSEKIAEQLCELLEIPHVQYEIAKCNGRLGVISKNIVKDNSRMVMGNEVLHNHSPGIYPTPTDRNEETVRVREHTVTRVLGTLDKNISPPETTVNINGLNAGDVFCGYLMLDVLISNQDRHHENWAIISSGDKNSLCPTYDHAASLGRELLDKRRNLWLSVESTDERVDRSMRNFVSKAKSELFKSPSDKSRLTTLDAFLLAVERREGAKLHWLSKLEPLTYEAIASLFNRVPDEVITQSAREFGIQMVVENRKRLLEK